MAAGRPKADIDWEKVKDLCIAGCTGTEIAGYFGVDKTTIYERCQDDNGELYSEFSRRYKSKGESILRAHQFSKAMGTTHKGDNTLLIWLGKTRLKQTETVNTNTSLTIQTTNYSDAEDPCEIKENES